MKKILLLSDTHGCNEDSILKHVKTADEVWHAGDWGNMDLVNSIEALNKPIRGVYGNIDGQSIRQQFPLSNVFDCEGLSVLMHHIGGYPGHYKPGVKTLIKSSTAKVFISGHSHILRVMKDPELNILFINPGAAGRHGFHHMRTMIQFEISNGQIHNMAVIELGKRSALQ